MYCPGIGIVSKDPALTSAIVFGIQQLFQPLSVTTLRIRNESAIPLSPVSVLPLHQQLLNKAVNQIGRLEKTFNVSLYVADSLEQLCHQLTEQQQDSLDLLFYDNQLGISAQQLQERLDSFYSALSKRKISGLRSPLSLVYFTSPPSHGLVFSLANSVEHYVHKQQSHWQAIIASQSIVDTMEFLLRYYCNPLLARKLRSLPHAGRIQGVTEYGRRFISLATFMLEFFTARADDNWLFGYYTGSVIAPFIDALEQGLAQRQITIINGCNEHSLACSALANWQLYRSPFLLTVTCGMMLEFKGTLLNLKRSRARGFIVCGEGEPNHWFAAQGMMNAEEDIRRILDGMAIAWVYMCDPQQMEHDLIEAQNLYDRDQGPVVLLATPRVLDSCRSLPSAVIAPIPVKKSASQAIPSLPDNIMALLNQHSRKLLWVVDSPLSAQERTLLMDIARQAGIALADSVQRPGCVSAYPEGNYNAQYLGTLGVYGTSRELLSYLYQDGELNPKQDQVIFFLKSRLGQPSSPFPPGNFKHRLETIQVTENAAHIAPHASQGLCMKLVDFLLQIKAKLAVDPQVLAYRQTQIARAKSLSAGLLSQLPSCPMSPDYFFYRFSELLKALIQKQAYRYTGLFDAGRCGFSALGSLPRTGPGFSSIYGRGCMGDALMAFPLVALKNPGNTVAFVGDGARNLAPDILPFLLKNLRGVKSTVRGSATLFIFVNNSLSMVRTYQERALLGHAGEQMNSLSLYQSPAVFYHAGVKITQHSIIEFDPEQMHEWLTSKNSINIIQVMTAHNNQGDMYRHFSTDWYY
ncbi:hypothetical protein [Bowmanella denitrificans]|uniref:hypothetical protein n=1 Tax=Bowmanella denitrificans TaxID=366582 RepID=UPI000C9BDFC1|nr:hypothetical protein [Bowmanella denitrificans]